jgi:hypothetical protein
MGGLSTRASGTLPMAASGTGGQATRGTRCNLAVSFQRSEKADCWKLIALPRSRKSGDFRYYFETRF